MIPRTIYAACLARLGLSQPEAAALHDVRLDTVKSWSSGRNQVPPRVFDELREYAERVAERSKDLMDVWIEDKAEEVQLNVVAEHLPMMAAADFVLRLPKGVRILAADE